MVKDVQINKQIHIYINKCVIFDYNKIIDYLTRLDKIYDIKIATKCILFYI